jgi:hypothetical protein
MKDNLHHVSAYLMLMTWLRIEDNLPGANGLKTNVIHNTRYEDTELKEKRRIIEEDVVLEILCLTMIFYTMIQMNWL